jgi:hypothetical protein
MVNHGFLDVLFFSFLQQTVNAAKARKNSILQETHTVHIILDRLNTRYNTDQTTYILHKAK